jgi:hypothetical protein
MNTPNSTIIVVPQVNVEEPSHHKTSTSKSNSTPSWNPNTEHPIPLIHFNVST